MSHYSDVHDNFYDISESRIHENYLHNALLHKQKLQAARAFLKKEGTYDEKYDVLFEKVHYA